MNRSSFLKHLALLSAGTALLPRLKVFQNSPFTELRNGIGTFSMRGGTIGWMARPGFTVVVDSQYSDTASDFLEGIGRFDGGPETVLINSHHHGDHVSGNGAFRDAGYRILAHEQVPILQRRGADESDEVVAAEETYSDKMELDAGDETVLLKYYGNAHTGGDTVTWFQNANIAHMGDLVFNRLYPFIDRDGGASISGWINLLETVADEGNPDTLYIFGHGNPEFGVTGGRADLLHMRDFLTKVLEHTRFGIEQGRSREEITQATSFDEFPDFISPVDFLSLPRNLDVAYRELTEENG